MLVDVVYNHAGGGFDAQSIDHFDFPEAPGRPQQPLLLRARSGRAGACSRSTGPTSATFLIDNAKMFLDEYHADGLRFDEVSVIDAKGGWSFCQDLTETLRYDKPAAALIAEYWGEQPLARRAGARRTAWASTSATPTSCATASADVLAQVGGRRERAASISSRLRRGLERPWNLPFAWQAYNCIENHDLVLDADGDHRKPRIARLADSTNSRSWYARSRARVATGLLLTAPGVPMLFMGQEFLEDKLWSDNSEPRRAC